MQSANFTAASDVTTKLIDVCNENSANKPQILYNRKFQSYRGGQRGNNGNYRNNNRNNFGRGNYGNNGSNRNANGNNGGNNYNNANSGGNGYNNGGRGNNHYRGSNQRGNGRNVRYAENSQVPQMSLGGNSTTSSQ